GWVSSRGAECRPWETGRVAGGPRADDEKTAFRRTSRLNPGARRAGWRESFVRHARTDRSPTSDLCRRPARVGEDRAAQFRRAHRADRPDAPGAGRAAQVGERRAVFARVELLHAVAGAGGAAAGDLRRVAVAPGVGRAGGGGVVRVAGRGADVGDLVALRDAGRRAAGGGGFLRAEAGGAGDRGRGGAPDRSQGAQ